MSWMETLMGRPDNDAQRKNRRQQAELRTRIIHFQNLGAELNRQIIGLQTEHVALGRTLGKDHHRAAADPAAIELNWPRERVARQKHRRQRQPHYQYEVFEA